MRKTLLILSVAAFYFSCTPNTAKIDDSMQKFFDSAGVKGSFAILNNQRGDVTVFNMKTDTTRIAPGSIFKIVETLIGVETSRLTGESSKLQTPDSNLAQVPLKKAFDENNRDYFNTLANRIGQDTLQQWINTISYGNMQVSNAQSLWDDGDLKISPDEQLGLVYKVYFDKLPFQKYAQEILRDLMLKEDNTLYKLSYTTGNIVTQENEHRGWITGWIEENRHVYFFTGLIQTNNAEVNVEETAIHIAKSILTSKGFFKGEN